MKNIPLVIDSQERPGNGDTNTWSPLENTEKFIENIETVELSEKTNKSTFVSGIPTAFARVDLFKNAIDNVANKTVSKNKGGLVSYYRELVDEWKGLIAAMALDYQNFSTRTIELVYSDNANVFATTNVYEPKGAFGNMLLERRKRWSDLSNASDGHYRPRITIIKYYGNVVGATSPETIVFTSSAYSVAESKPWLRKIELAKDDSKNPKTISKFTDPLKAELSQDELSRLYAYVKYILSRMEDFEAYFAGLEDNLRPNYGTIKKLLDEWASTMETMARNKRFNLAIGSIPPVETPFCAPFNILLNYTDKLYGLDGEIKSTSTPGAIEFSPAELLLPKSAKIARIHLEHLANSSESLKDMPVFMLRAIKKNDNKGFAFFALPLSALGINMYGKTIGALVGDPEAGVEVQSTLTAIYDPEALEDQLEVTLEIKTEDGKMRKTSRTYTVGNSDGVMKKDIILWPNFISRHWDKYYLYSELPHNNSPQTYSAFPFVGDTTDQYFRILTDEEGNPFLLGENGEAKSNEKVSAKLLVKATSAIAENPYKYEIYESNMPFKGVRLLSPTGDEGGYLLVNYTSSSKDHLPQNKLEETPHLTDVFIGFDFGSTNTSIAYSKMTEKPKGFQFKNRRVSLLGSRPRRNERGEIEWVEDQTNPNQILFFQGPDTPLQSNSIKSILTLHDELRLRKKKENELESTKLSEPVAGGFPCFIENLPVKSVKEDMIILEYPKIGVIRQVHNMKWIDNERDNAHKEAYLKTLMIQVCAELFNEEVVPTKLIWSYPSSMSTQLLGRYQIIWDNLRTVSPIKINGKQKEIDISRSPVSFDDTIRANGLGGFGSKATPSGFGGRTSGFGQGSSAFGGGSAFGVAQPAQPSAGTFGGNAFGAQQAQPGAGNGFGNGGFGAVPNQPAGGFGGGTASAFGTPAAPQPEASQQNAPEGFQPDSPDRVVRYDPVPLITPNKLESMTEATAVANFKAKGAGTAGTLLITLDIGGSTTDISALYNLKVDDLTMIKQNSLRFAAQRVSHATASLPGFKNVLAAACSAFDIKMMGFNYGPERYDDSLAPYYFDQIVSRLKDDQLVPFYKLIRANCPALMAMNLYVTGLLVYYAGEIAHKLIDDLIHTTPDELPNKPVYPNLPIVTVEFAGKGSRLLQWLTAIDQNLSHDYYTTMFQLGFGPDIATMVGGGGISLPALDYKDIKYEVSMGLAINDSKLFKPKEGSASEIIGEGNFSFQSPTGAREPISFLNTFTPPMMNSIGFGLIPGPVGQNCPKFVEFCDLFYRAVRSVFDIQIAIDVFEKGFADMNIVKYIQSMPEFRDARQQVNNRKGEFDFVAPIIILEGMKFYDEHLLKAFK